MSPTITIVHPIIIFPSDRSRAASIRRLESKLQPSNEAVGYILTPTTHESSSIYLTAPPPPLSFPPSLKRHARSAEPSASAMRRRWRKHLLSFFLALFSLLSSDTTAASSDNACDPRSLPDPLTLRPDQLTVLISGYSERRVPLLRSIVAGYASLPFVAAVLILWGNPSTPSEILSPLHFSSSSVTVVRDTSPSLNARFLPRAAIRTRAVAVCDDDMEVDPRSLSLAFAVWRSHEQSLVGFFARSHELDLGRRTWIYAVHPDRYSIMLTKFMILKSEYLHRYSCWSRFAEARRLVDRERNCEDILMNFVAAMSMDTESREGQGPTTVLVQGTRVRDWGDPRNSGNSSRGGDDGVREEIRRVGLSARGDHRKRRGDCIGEFHRILRVMPLRYSYGKVVEGVGEQGLCSKGGKLLFCDRD